jgi:hypothetical protein
VQKNKHKESMFKDKSMTWLFMILDKFFHDFGKFLWNRKC